MGKLIRFCYWTSIPVFLAFLLYNYALLPERVGVLFDELGTASYSLEKGFFFYAVLGLFLLSNALFYLYFRMSLSVDADEEITTGIWALGLSAILNVTFAVLVLFVGIFHGRDIDPNQYTWLIYIGPVLTVAWIFYGIYLKVASK